MTFTLISLALFTSVSFGFANQTQTVAPSKTRTVLYLGDSQSYGSKKLGEMMYQFLSDYPEACHNKTKAEKNTLRFRAVEGSSFHSWTGVNYPWICRKKLNSGKIKARTQRVQFKGSLSQQITPTECEQGPNLVAHYLKQTPELFVFQLHGNSQGQGEANIKQQVKKFLQHRSLKTTCILLTSPPYVQFHQKNSLRQKTQEVIIEGLQDSPQGKSCHIIKGYTPKTFESIAVDPENYTDGMHLSRKGAKLFFEKFVKAKLCQFPI